MNINIYDKIRACYLAYINEKDLNKKLYYLKVLKEYLNEEKELHNGPKI